MTRIAILLATAALTFAGGPGARAQFDQLKTLAGKWEGKSPDGHTSNTTYEVISSGTALLERMAHDSMTSMYHVDGDRVLLTHYCAVGNQPRLALAAEGNVYTFTYVDATNVSSPKVPIIVKMVLRIVDKDNIVQEWTSRTDGKLDSLVVELHRVK